MARSLEQSHIISVIAILLDVLVFLGLDRRRILVLGGPEPGRHITETVSDQLLR